MLIIMINLLYHMEYKVILSFGGEWLLSWPDCFRQYSTQVWYGIKVLPQGIWKELEYKGVGHRIHVILTFGGAGVLFWPYRFRQYSTHVWYGFDVFGQPFTGPSTLGGSSGFSLSNAKNRNEKIWILHDSYRRRSTKNLPQWAIPFSISAPLLHPSYCNTRKI